MTGKTGADAPSWRQPRQAPSAAATAQHAPTAPAAIPTAAVAAAYSASPEASLPVGSPTSGGWAAWKSGKKDSDNWRAHPPPAVVLQQHQQHQAAPSLIVGSPPKTPRSPRSALDAAGPATPLNPLIIATAGAARPLAHPNLSPRLGGENWALTPSSSLPSLPGTPRRPPRSMGSQGSEDVTAGGLMMGSPAFRAMAAGNSAAAAASAQMSSGSSSRDLAAARALLNRRTDEAGGTAVRAGAPPATPAPPPPVAAQRNLAVNVAGSPKRSPLSLAPTSTAMLPPAGPPGNRVGRATPNLSPGPSPRLSNRSVSPIDTSRSVSSILAPSAVVPGAVTPVQSLLRRDSMASITSSSTPAGAHTLSHSRKASQVFSPSSTASPSSSSVMSGATGYRPYRPPHLRNRDSGHNLRPAVQHYDRVRTPSLRGQSRSPDPSSAAASSRAGSRPPSTTPFSPTSELPEMLGRAPGRRRLSSLGSFQSVVPEDLPPPPPVDEREERQGEASATVSPSASETVQQPRTPESNGNMDSRTLMDKLVLTWSARRSAQLPPAAASSYGGDEESVVDDVDFSIDEMLAASGSQLSLTDSFCLSRHASHLTNDARPVDIFEVGDRLGPGMMHDGLRIGIAETSDGFEQQVADVTGSQLEVVRKLGEGSYAVVYLVREVDPDDAPLHDDGAFGAPDGLTVSATPKPGHNEEELYSRTLRASDLADKTVSGDASNAARHTPREFALKCLCKRDLSDEMLEVQRLESTIHQSIPRHPHIVTLYRTYETADWLFLILEYCPGQDLYYWLEQAQDADVPTITNGHGRYGSDSEAADGSVTLGDASITLGGYASGDTTVHDATPPSPSLLASTAGAALLSRKRLRLVSRMFRQMCEAVQFCHDRGISHRDIKPENFIVEDRRSQEDAADEVEAPRASSRPGTAASRRRRSSSLSAFGDSMRDSEARITVKLTDFGLAVAQEQCVDFDCGSKPYMAYECRNNVSQWYDPRQADIWSLGVVLLNLLFHRSPFSEPSVDGCDSFAAYSYDPVRFLTQAFDGLTEGAADFLAQNVLCDVTNPKSDGSPRRRITAKEFGAWAADLPQLLSVDGKPPRGADADVTSPMQHSRSPSSSGLGSLLGSPSAQSSVGPPPLTIHEELGDDGQTSYPSLFPEYADRNDNDSPRRAPASRHFSSASLSPHPEGTPDILPSPTFSPPPRAHAELFPLENGTAAGPGTPEVQTLDRQQGEQDDSPHTAKPPLSAKVETPRTARPPESASTQAAINWFEQQVATAAKTSSTPSAVSWFEQQVAEATRAKPAAAVQTEVPAAAAPVTAATSAPVEEDAGAEQVEELVGAEGEVDGGKANGDQDDDGDDSNFDGSQYDGTDGTGSIAGSMNPKRRKRGARKGRNDKKQDLKRSHSAENLASLTDASMFPPMRRGEGREPISPHPRDAVLAELAAASQTLARQMSRAKPSGSSVGTPSVPSSPLWGPTHLSNGSSSALPGRRPSATPSLGLSQVPSFMRDQDGMVDSPLGDTFGQESVGSRASTQYSNYSWAGRAPSIASTNASGRLTDSSSGPSSSLASNVKPKWASSGAPRDGRLLREPRGPPLEDSGRSQPRSWRDRNPSTASIDSTSTFSSVFSDAPSSIYSTASAPAAAGRRSTASLASSTGPRPSGGSSSRFSKTGLLNIAGLDTISEKKRAQVKGDPLDASYLAAIFGAPPSKPVSKPSRRKEASAPDHYAMPPESRVRPRQASASSDHSNSSQRTAHGKAAEISSSNTRKDASASSGSLGVGHASDLSPLATPPVPEAEPVAAAPAPTPSKTSNIAKFFSRRG